MWGKSRKSSRNPGAGFFLLLAWFLQARCVIPVVPTLIRSWRVFSSPSRQVVAGSSLRYRWQVVALHEDRWEVKRLRKFYVAYKMKWEESERVRGPVCFVCVRCYLLRRFWLGWIAKGLMCCDLCFWFWGCLGLFGFLCFVYVCLWFSCGNPHITTLSSLV